MNSRIYLSLSQPGEVKTTFFQFCSGKVFFVEACINIASILLYFEVL